MAGSTKADTPIRVALIGYGFAGRTFHVPLIQAVDGFDITVVASRRPADVHAVAPQAEVLDAPNAPQAAASHANADLVVIASPNDSHAPLAEAALQAGKHVVVDKPFTLDVAQARRLTAVAHETNRFLSVFHNRRWDSDFITVRKAIADNLLGDIVLFESRFDRYRLEVRDRWREAGGPGSGVLYDLGPHLIDQALTLFGPPDDVRATLAAQRPGARATDFCLLELRYARRIVLLRAGMLVAGGSPRFAIHGSLASLIKHKPDIQEDQLRTGAQPGDKNWGVDPDPAELHIGADQRTEHITPLRGDQRQYYVAIREALRNGAPNPVTPEQASTTMAIIEAAMRSHAEGNRIAPDLTDAERAAW